MYLSYAEYQGFGGTMDSASFERLEFMARKKVDAETFGRIADGLATSEAVKRLMFELIGLIHNCDATSESYAAEPTSESNDGYSVSFGDGSLVTTVYVEEKTSELIRDYLADEAASDGTPLLYCGA